VTEGETIVALWWALPQFRGVEVWPGRGFLVELPGGQVEFVRDLEATHPPGHRADSRFYDPPPTRRSPESPRPRPTTRPPRRFVRPPGDDDAPSVDERFDATVGRLRPRAAEQLPYRAQPDSARRRTAGRARDLLVSLLDRRQQRELDHLGHFWVHGEFGSVRLGRLYDIVHRSRHRRSVEHRLCVVTRAHGDIPPDDEWTSIVLTLAHDPDRFFRVANLRRVIDHGTDLRSLRAALDGALALGDPQDAAFSAFDLGMITDRALATEAAAWIEAHALLDPTNAERYRRHHSWLLDRRTGRDEPPRDERHAWLRTTRRFAIHATP
jgi:hypothetical protein